MLGSANVQSMLTVWHVELRQSGKTKRQPPRRRHATKFFFRKVGRHSLSTSPTRIAKIRWEIFLCERKIPQRISAIRAGLRIAYRISNPDYPPPPSPRYSIHPSKIHALYERKIPLLLLTAALARARVLLPTATWLGKGTSFVFCGLGFIGGLGTVGEQIAAEFEKSNVLPGSVLLITCPAAAARQAVKLEPAGAAGNSAPKHEGRS